MDYIQIIALGIIQGLTEFLPVSSSAHLVLLSIVMGWQDQGLLIDVAAHAGSLLAVLLYFRKDLMQMMHAIKTPTLEEDAKILKLMQGIIIATIPIIVVGLLFADTIETYMRDADVIAATTILFAVLLAYADRNHRESINEYALSWKAILFIGIAQAFALIPGTSRSGVTMMAGLMMGLSRVAAARYSFLLSIPTILAAITYKSSQLFMTEVNIDYLAIICVFLVASVVAYVCIGAFVRLVNIIGMMPFVIYRIILGLLLIIFV